MYYLYAGVQHHLEDQSQYASAANSSGNNTLSFTSQKLGCKISLSFTFEPVSFINIFIQVLTWIQPHQLRCQATTHF